MVTDPIADFLTRIRNAQMANHRIVEIPASNLKKRITEILYNQGYILKYKFEDDKKQGLIKIALKYDGQSKVPAIQSLERISRPGKMGRDGSGGDSQDGGGAVGIEIEQDPQDDHLSLPGGESIERRHEAWIDPLCRVWRRNTVGPAKRYFAAPPAPPGHS